MFFSYREIDRAIYENIRRRLVAMNKFPDIRLYGTIALFEAAKTTLRAAQSDKALIEVFGVGAPESRDEKTYHKIVIDRKAAPKGDIGSWGVITYEENEDEETFTKKRMPDSTRNIRYEIRYITNTAQGARMCSEAVDEALGTMRYIRTYNDDGTPATVTVEGQTVPKVVFLELVNEIDVSTKEMLEYIMVYDVKDVFLSRETDLESGTIVSTEIPALVEVGGGTAVIVVPDEEITEIKEAEDPAEVDLEAPNVLPLDFDPNPEE